MPAAISLQDAAELAQQNVQIVFQDARSLRTQLQVWMTGLQPPLLDATNQNQRTVLDWNAVGTVVLQTIPTLLANETQADANDVSDYLFRACWAAAAAETAGRITPAQGVAILALYNATWP
jgi:hypothetical protein